MLQHKQQFIILETFLTQLESIKKKVAGSLLLLVGQTHSSQHHVNCDYFNKMVLRQLKNVYIFLKSQAFHVHLFNFLIYIFQLLVLLFFFLNCKNKKIATRNE